jgi:hypothetical protein
MMACIYVYINISSHIPKCNGTEKYTNLLNNNNMFQAEFQIFISVYGQYLSWLDSIDNKLFQWGYGHIFFLSDWDFCFLNNYIFESYHEHPYSHLRVWFLYLFYSNAHFQCIFMFSSPGSKWGIFIQFVYDMHMMYLKNVI